MVKDSRIGRLSCPSRRLGAAQLGVSKLLQQQVAGAIHGEILHHEH